jgi:hypothetical protein
MSTVAERDTLQLFLEKKKKRNMFQSWLLPPSNFQKSADSGLVPIHITLIAINLPYN